MPGAGYTGFAGYIGPAGSGQGAVAGDSYGGIAIPLLAAEALNIGDAVYLSAANHVSKGASANIAAGIGIVVGGKATKGRTYPEIKFGSVAAAAAEDWVLVCVQGKARALSNAAIAMGAAVAFSAVAGKIDDVTTDATTVVGTRLGKSLTVAGGADVEIDVLVGNM